jgi:hypothetical protein
MSHAARVLGRDGLDQIRLGQRHGALVDRVTPDSGGQMVGGSARARDDKHRSASIQAPLDVGVGDLATVDEHRGWGISPASAVATWAIQSASAPHSSPGTRRKWL